MKPLSTGHYDLLKRFNLCSPSNAGDLLTGVLICSMQPGEFVRFISGAAASITTFGVVAVVLVAAAAAAYFLWKHIHALNESAATLRRWYDLTPTFRESADAMQKAADVAERYREKIDEINKSHETLGHRLEAQSKLLKERQQLEKQLAQEQGKSKTEILALEMRQLQAEKDLEEAHRKQLETQVNNDRIAADNAAAAAGSKEAFTAIEVQKRMEDRSKEVVDAFKAAFSNDKSIQRLLDMKAAGATTAGIADGTPVFGPSGGLSPSFKQVPIDEAIQQAQSSVTKVKVGAETIYRTFDKASAEYNKLLGSTKKLEEAQKHLEKIADDAAHGLQVDTDDLRKTQEKIRELTGQIDLHKQFDPLLGSAGRGRIPSDSLISTGNFLGTSRTAIGSIEQKKLDALHQIVENTKAFHEWVKHGGPMSGYAGQDVQYPVA